MAKPKKVIFPTGVLFIGLIGFFTMMGRPSFQAMRTVDIVQLLGSGACFGVGFVMLLMRLRQEN
jgi:hypothetical protein